MRRLTYEQNRFNSSLLQELLAPHLQLNKNLRTLHVQILNDHTRLIFCKLLGIVNEHAPFRLPQLFTIITIGSDSLFTTKSSIREEPLT